MTEKRRLLFTGGGGAGMEAIWRLWHEKYELFFADCDVTSFAATIPIERQTSLWAASDPNFLEHLAHQCDAFMIHLLIPCVDEEIKRIWQLSTGYPTMLPLPSQLGFALGKHATNGELREAGFNPPGQMLKKPDFGRGSAGQEVVEEILTGQEYTVCMCATKAAQLRAVVPVRVDKKKGITIRGATEYNQTIVETCTKIHQAFKPRACYNIQGFLTEDNEFRPFEINPRISTTFCLVIAAGIDPVEIFYDEETNLNWTRGVELRRTWHNEIIQPTVQSS